MKVQQLMTAPVRTCGSRDSLERAAQLLWEHDCGVLPVVDEAGRVEAMITDRDICMAAYTGGKRLADLRVAGSMAQPIVACRPDEDAAVVAQRMIDQGVRRLPVVDDRNQLHGIVSLGDLAREGTRDKDLAGVAVRVLAAVTKPRSARSAPVRSAPVRKPERAEVLLAGKTEQEC